MTSRVTRRWATVAAVAVAVAAALVYTRALGTRTNYDEGVYLASLDAMRRGEALGSDIYTSQPPVFYWLLRALAAPVGSSISGIRVAFALFAVLGVVAAVVLGWRLYGAAAGIAAGALVAIGPPYPTVAPTVSADVPAVVLGLASLALLAFALRPEAPRGWAAAAGALLALAVLTKLLAIPFVVPFAALVLAARSARRLLPAALVGTAAAAGVVVALNAAAAGDLWREVVGDHTSARELGSFSGNVHQLRDFLDLRTPFGWLVPVGFLAFVLSRRARRTWPLWSFVPAAAGFLVLVRPLEDHHLVLLSVACAIAAGPSLALAVQGLPGGARLAATALLVVFVAGGFYQEQRRLQRNDVAEPAELTWATAAVERATAPGALVVSDQPIVVYRAHRPTPGPLVDVSSTRVTGRTLTAADIESELRRTRPRAVVVDRMLRFLPGVVRWLDLRYPEQARCGGATLFLAARAALPACPVHS